MLDDDEQTSSIIIIILSSFIDSAKTFITFLENIAKFCVNFIFLFFLFSGQVWVTKSFVLIILAHAAQRARHSYGPQGHRGMSVLIFEASAGGYLEAERLHKHFTEQRTDKETWFRNRCIWFLPGGKRQLYGYMATKEDLEFFNRHCKGSFSSVFSFYTFNMYAV
jgi:hypothetical protein